MSYFNMVCDSCGRDVCGCNIVNGMKFCAKCYQETFGNQQKYIDMLNKESSELLVNSLAEKDRQIAELKAENERLKEQLSTATMYHGCDILIAELQQQLKSQPAEIVEKIRDLAGDYFYENSKEDLLLTGSDFTEILDTILKEYQK